MIPNKAVIDSLVQQREDILKNDDGLNKPDLINQLLIIETQLLTHLGEAKTHVCSLMTKYLENISDEICNNQDPANISGRLTIEAGKFTLRDLDKKISTSEITISLLKDLLQAKSR